MQVPNKYKFIVQLGKALHHYGVPSYKSEMFLTEVAAKKGIKASFMDLPTWINYVFYEDDEQTYNHVQSVKPGELNLGALAKTVGVANNLINDIISFEEAKEDLDEIDSTPTKYGPILQLIGFVVSAGAFSIILDTGWVSAAVAAFVGAIIFHITLLAKRYPYVRSTLEALVSFVSTIVIGLLSLWIDQINISLTILASIIVFIPGLSITTALEEITAKNLVSGTAKLFDALVSLFKQFLGVVLGLTILRLLVDIDQQPVINNVPLWMDYVAIILLALSLSSAFKIQIRDLFFCVMVGFISYFTTTLFAFAGIFMSIFMGTMVTVAVSKLFSRLNNSPRLVFLVPGIIMLVPGSKAFLGLSSVLLDQANSTPNLGEQIAYIFMGIIGGLLFSGTFMDIKLKEHNQ